MLNNTKNYDDDTRALRMLPVDVVAQTLGLEHDDRRQKEKGGAGAGYTYWRGDGEQKIVANARSREGNPIWRLDGLEKWTDNLGLVQMLNPQLNIGHCKARLRRAVGLRQQNSFSPLPIHVASTILLARAPLPDLCAAPAWADGWLLGRGISCEAIAHARIAGMSGVDNGKFQNLAFSHINSKGDVTGFEIRGVSRKFKGFIGIKSFFLLPPRGYWPSPVLCAVESAIDCLALFDFLESRNKSAWIASTAGNFTPSQCEQILALATDLKISKIVAAQDADHGGDAQAQRLSTSAATAGIECVRMSPPTPHGDWAEWTENSATPAKRTA